MARQTTRGSSGRGGAGRGGNQPPPEAEEPPSGSVEPIEIQEEMERSFLEYSMSVIVARALPDLHKTNFIEWLTGIVYTWFGVDIIVGFFVFGLVAFVGSYLWYRATVVGVPFIDKRLYFLLVFFAPSVAMQGGPGPAELLARSSVGREVRRKSLAAVVCALAGYFTERSLGPPQP